MQYLIIAIIFGYAGWAIYRSIQKSKQGKCAACSMKDSCQTGCVSTSLIAPEKPAEPPGKVD